MKINGKTALVTGANRGIGFAIVNVLRDDGGRQMFDVWNNDYRDLEAMVNQMHHAA